MATARSRKPKPNPTTPADARVTQVQSRLARALAGALVREVADENTRPQIRLITLRLRIVRVDAA